MLGFDDGYPKPKDYPIHGIDVSKYQGTIDWNAVANSGVKFAWIKATEGGDHVDERFQANWQGAKLAGVAHGAYHFMYWCRPPIEEATWFEQNVPVEEDALPPVLDVEPTPDSRTCRRHLERNQTIADMKVVLEEMERHFGKRPVIYTNLEFYNAILAGGAFANYPIWVRSTKHNPADALQRPRLAVLAIPSQRRRGGHRRRSRPQRLLRRSRPVAGVPRRAAHARASHRGGARARNRRRKRLCAAADDRRRRPGRLELTIGAPPAREIGEAAGGPTWPARAALERNGPGPAGAAEGVARPAAVHAGALVGARVLIAGHGPLIPTDRWRRRWVRSAPEVSAAEAYGLARLTGLAMLASLKRAIGDLDRVTALGRAFSAWSIPRPGFTDTPGVINGFSDLILELYGPEIGAHARSAVGMAALPFNTAVEIEAEVEIST